MQSKVNFFKQTTAPNRRDTLLIYNGLVIVFFTREIGN